MWEKKVQHISYRNTITRQCTNKLIDPHILFLYTYSSEIPKVLMILCSLMFYMSLSIWAWQTQRRVIQHYDGNILWIKSYSLYFSILRFPFLPKDSLLKVLENSVCYISNNIGSLLSCTYCSRKMKSDA
jgi:hypothetical protein